MNREEIYDKACEFVEERLNEGMLYDIKTEIQFSFERGAEWMQEQCDAESDKDFARHLRTEAELRIQIDKIREDDDKTIARLQAEIDELNNQLSELTEQLDAAHVFCEGVRDLMTERACREFCHNCTNYENCEGYCDRYKHFNETMKGE